MQLIYSQNINPGNSLYILNILSITVYTNIEYVYSKHIIIFLFLIQKFSVCACHLKANCGQVPFSSNKIVKNIWNSIFSSIQRLSILIGLFLTNFSPSLELVLARTNYTICLFISYSQTLVAPSTPQLYPCLTRNVSFTSDSGIGKREGQKKKKKRKETKVQDFPQSLGAMALALSSLAQVRR